PLHLLACSYSTATQLCIRTADRGIRRGYSTKDQAKVSLQERDSARPRRWLDQDAVPARIHRRLLLADGDPLAGLRRHNHPVLPSDQSVLCARLCCVAW